ncbi:MAG: PilZ domain-containing protein [Firmicutes bacterium]|nr:PilZ domain-containing protein [Bacillota bacterium]
MTIKTSGGRVRLHRGQRIYLSGLDAYGRYFNESAELLTADAQGCSLSLKSKLLPDHELRLSQEGTSDEILVRLVRAVPQGESFLYQLKFVEPQPEPEAEPFRFLLVCEQCRTRSFAHLNRSEAHVLQAAGLVTRRCPHCDEVTLWKRVEHEAQLDRDKGERQPAAPEPRRSERRRRSRARMKVMVLIRWPGFGEEMVPCLDLSRDGLSFLSAQRYPIGQRIDVIAPYQPHNPSPPVHGRIVYVLEQPGTELLRYGVQYLPRETF